MSKEALEVFDEGLSFGGEFYWADEKDIEIIRKALSSKPDFEKRKYVNPGVNTYQDGYNTAIDHVTTTLKEST